MGPACPPSCSFCPRLNTASTVWPASAYLSPSQVFFSYLLYCVMPAKLTTKGWIARARAVHGLRYDYSLVVYRASTAIVVIGCAVHGRFAQAGNHHLQGQGCPACRATGAARAQHGSQKAAPAAHSARKNARCAGEGSSHAHCQVVVEELPLYLVPWQTPLAD